MNKKQLIVTWVVVGFITTIFILATNQIATKREDILEKAMPPFIEKSLQIEVIKFQIKRYKEFINYEILKTIFLTIPSILIGGLLIYTLRNKKK